MGVNSLPNTVTRQRRACDFWTQALLRMSPAWVRFLVYNTGLVQYRWTGLDLLTADRVKMQDWRIVNSSKYFLSCCTYVFYRCRFVLAFSVAPYGVLADAISVPADSAAAVVKFTISIPRESCTNAKAKYSSSVVPPDPSVHFYHWTTLIWNDKKTK